MRALAPLASQSTAGTTKLAAEKGLSAVLQLGPALDDALAWVPSGGPLVRTLLQARWVVLPLLPRAAAAARVCAPTHQPTHARAQESYLRRLGKLPVEDDDGAPL